jgi:sugar lactone lactonase YvrE
MIRCFCLCLSVGALTAATFLPCRAAETAKPNVNVKFLLTWGKKGSAQGEFSSPIGIAINRSDEIFVTDLHNHRVQKFTANGKFLAAIDISWDGQPGHGSGPGVAVDRSGQIYVSFMEEHKVGVYTESGELVRQWGKKGQAAGEFKQPGGIALGPDGSVYVADQGNHRVQQFTPEGTFLAQWGEHGSQPGQFGGEERAGSRFAGPHFMAINSQGCVYTTEGVLGRVQKFTAERKFLLSWGDKGDQPGGFGALKTPYSPYTFGPIGICTDLQDRVWVSSLNNRVQLYSSEGEYLTGVGGHSFPLLDEEGKYVAPRGNDEPGHFLMPHAMVVDSHGCLYVVDATHNRIQKFKVTDVNP